MKGNLRVVNGGISTPRGSLLTEIIRPTLIVSPKDLERAGKLNLRELIHDGMPHRGLHPKVNAWRRSNLKYLRRSWFKLWCAQHLLKVPTLFGTLALDAKFRNGDELFMGLAGFRVVTTAGVGYAVDAWQNSVELEDMKYHGLGEDNTAENSSDTALGSELTTQLNPDSTRATGSLTEGATANIFRTVGTLTFDASVAIVEHGLFDQAATGGGVLWDRTVFGEQDLGSGESLQATYDLTLTAGS